MYHEKTVISLLFILSLTFSLVPYQVEGNNQSARKEMIAKAAQSKDVFSLTALITILETDPDGYTRAFAAWALGEIGDAGAKSSLNNALNDIDKGVRAEAKNALVKLK